MKKDYQEEGNNVIANQLNPDYKNVYLGYSKKYKINDSGCLLCCVSRLLQKPVLEVHEKLKTSGCFYADKTGDVCLLDLTKVPTAYPQLTYIGKETVWDQDKATATIKGPGGLIVEVDSNSIMAGTQQHFVFFRGNGEMEDPLGGKVRPTTYYKVISMRIFELKVLQEETMTDDQKRALDIINKYKVFANHGNLEGAANAAVSATVELKNAQERITAMQGILAETTKTINELTLKVKQMEKNEASWQTDMSTAKEELGKMTEDRDAKWAQYKNKNDEFNALLARTQSPSELIKMFISLFKK